MFLPFFSWIPSRIVSSNCFVSFILASFRLLGTVLFRSLLPGGGRFPARAGGALRVRVARHARGGRRKSVLYSGFSSLLVRKTLILTAKIY